MIIGDNELPSVMRLHISHYPIYSTIQFVQKFDGDRLQISDVYEEVVVLRERLGSMPETEFLTSSRKWYILNVFDARKTRAFFYRPVNELKMKRPECRLFPNIHYCAYVLTPTDCHTQQSLRTPMSAFKKHAAAFGSSLGIFGEALDLYVDKMEQ